MKKLSFNDGTVTEVVDVDIITEKLNILIGCSDLLINSLFYDALKREPNDIPAMYVNYYRDNKRIAVDITFLGDIYYFKAPKGIDTSEYVYIGYFIIPKLSTRLAYQIMVYKNQYANVIMDGALIV